MSPDGSDSNKNPFKDCSKSKPDVLDKRPSAEADFSRGSTDFAYEVLSKFDTADQAGSALAAYTGYIDSCKTFEADGHRLTVGQLSLPSAGDESHPYRLSGEINGVKVSFDVVLARTGPTVVLIENGGLGTADSDFTTDFLGKALAKASGAPASSSASATDTAAASSPAAKSSAAPSKAHVGNPVELKGDSAGEKIQVTPLQVVDNAKSSDSFIKPKDGDKYVAVQFLIENTGTAPYSDSPGYGATLIDSESQQYKQGFVTGLSAGPLFSGTVNIAPGDQAKGFVAFEVPAATVITGVQFTTSLFGGNVGQWVVP